MLPYTLATLVGLMPGTAAVVILGDALTGNVSPLLFLVSLCTGSVGVAGLIYEIRTHRRHHGDREADSPAAQSRRSPARPTTSVTIRRLPRGQPAAAGYRGGYCCRTAAGTRRQDH